jgi:hypothetical protein
VALHYFAILSGRGLGLRAYGASSDLRHFQDKRHASGVGGSFLSELKIYRHAAADNVALLVDRFGMKGSSAMPPADASLIIDSGKE